ncbi:tumor necrosis factor receptor superfamily member 10A isoform X2 [Sarcophilus harrisii]|uniref:tumor necrosis factor receptor superfamily member 10A isoform X2 n=1 Tax=Sarcophilus harrisii TaxID=9305 RepID=UPI00130209E7|nr:tumor necrosis factor receptor superfamily member 10A isoform X2 [Sarcophilus harrisii]
MCAPRPVPGKHLPVVVVLSLFLVDSVGTMTAGPQQLQKHGPDVQCPAGQYLKTILARNKTGVCAPCRSGIDFTEYPNGLPSCIPCQICKPGQKEEKPCTITQNTQCHCKSGTFCPKDHPCEICKKCKFECPKGMVEINPCSPWSDLECARPLTSNTRNHWLRYLLLAPVLIFVVGPLIFFLRGFCAYPEVDPEKAKSPEKIEMTGLLNPQSLSLFPADGNHIKTLEKSFYIFEEEVPWESWDKYMRQLGLSNNDIVSIKHTETNAQEHPHKLLMKWLNKTGKDASVDCLLKTLDQIHQKAARQNIQDRLIKSNLYICQEREDEKTN